MKEEGIGREGGKEIGMCHCYLSHVNQPVGRMAGQSPPALIPQTGSASSRCPSLPATSFQAPLSLPEQRMTKRRRRNRREEEKGKEEGREEEEEEKKGGGGRGGGGALFLSLQKGITNTPWHKQ